MKWLTILLFVVSLSCHGLELKKFATGINKPVHIAAAPGEPGRLYIVEQVGRVRIYENGKLQPTPFLDISRNVISGGEMGLLSIAFHPAYPTNGRYFVYYTSERGTPREIRISELRLGDTTEKVLLRIPHAKYTNHNGGQLAFDSKGLLYAGIGDGGHAGDPDKHGQNVNSLLGKILRIDINGASPYAIPSDNPFMRGGGKPEIYVWGMRNPWRFSFGPDDKLWVADVGQNELEEINIVEKGKNYGWNKMEASECFPKGERCNKSLYELPIHQYPRSDGGSITGGFVYRGKEIPSLVGKYIYADYMSGNVWALSYDAATKKVTNTKILTQTGISSFGEDEKGELYACLHFDNAVAKFVK